MPVPEAYGVPPPRWAGRAVALTTLILLAAVAYALWCDVALIWDGSYQLGETLIAGKPYAYLSRFHTLLLWQPVAWLSWHTENVKALTVAYGAPFLLTPIVSLLLCWWLVRRQAPMMILWAAIGILATPLPGQIFVINDSVFQQHLFWPLFLGLMVRKTPLQAVVVGFCAIFQFVHQIGVVLVAVAVGSAFILMLIETRQAERRRLVRQFACVSVLFVLVVAKTAWISVEGTPYYDSYAPQEAKWERIREAWLYGVDGWPLQGLFGVYFAAIAVLGQKWLVRAGRSIRADILSYLAALALLVTAVLWIHWAWVPGFWTSAINYRRWLVPLTAPIYLFALMEMAGRRWSVSRGTGQFGALPPYRTTVFVRSAMMIGLAILFAVVLCLQSTQFKHDSDRLQAEVMSSPHTSVPMGEDHWMRASPLNHWSTSWQVLLYQGKKPSKWIVGPDVTAENLKLLDGPGPKLPISSFTFRPPEPGPTGWFNLSEVIPAAIRERKAGLTGVAPTTKPATQP